MGLPYLILPYILLSGLLISAPVSAECLKNGNLDICEYPPLRDDNGRIVNIHGAPIESPAPIANAPQNMHRVTLTGSNSVCADGSPAIMYIRNASMHKDRHRWLIVLEGGGNGFSADGTLDQSMWDRWTGGGASSYLNTLSKSSTDWLGPGGAIGRDGIPDLPLQILKGGILSANRSSFATWNAIFLNYCSSDSWTGRASSVNMPTAGFWVDNQIEIVGFKMDFQGHNIIDDALNMLSQATLLADHNPAYPLENNLSNAETVLLAGESAGGGGVLYNLDFVTDKLQSINPNVQVIGSIGAKHHPPTATPVDSWWLDDNANGTDDMQESVLNRWDQMLQINAFVDQSCLNSGANSLCSLLSDTVPHFSTPVHIKQDMSDPLLSQPYNSVSNYQTGLSVDYGFWYSAQIPPFFAPDCGQHASLEGGNYFEHSLQQRELLPNGNIGAVVLDEVSYDEALERFAKPGPLSPVLIHHNLRGTTSAGTNFIWVSDC